MLRDQDQLQPAFFDRNNQWVKKLSSSQGWKVPDVFGEVGDEVGVRTIDDELSLRLPAHEAVSEDDLTLRRTLLEARRRLGAHHLLPIDLDAEAANKVLGQVAVEGRLDLFLADGQDVSQDRLPGVAVEG